MCLRRRVLTAGGEGPRDREVSLWVHELHGPGREEPAGDTGTVVTNEEQPSGRKTQGIHLR